MKNPLLMAALLMSVALPAAAQTASQIAPAAPQTEAAAQPQPPEAFRGAPDLTYRGMTGGIDYWHFAGSDYLIGQNRSDGTITIGYLFEPTGQDVSAVITGAEPLSLADFRKPDDAAAPLAETPAVEDTGLSPLVPEPGLIQNDSRLLEMAPESVRKELLAQLVEALDATTTREEYETAILKWRETVRNTLGQQPAPVLPQELLDQLKPRAETPAAPSAPAAAAEDAPAAEAPATDPLLEFRPTLSPNTAPEDLPAAALNPFSPPSGASQGVETPTADTASPFYVSPEQAQAVEPNAVPTQDADQAAPEAPSAATPQAAEPEAAEPAADAGAAVLPEGLSLEAGQDANADMSAELEAVANDLALQTLSTQSRWFSLGADTAPVVYAVIDPTCPYCSRALADLKDEVESGVLQLRVVMAPLLSPQSEDTIAGIMMSVSPGQVLFTNAEARAGRGGAPVAPRNATELPPSVRNDLAVNRQNIINLGISQIPYFAWQTEEGVQTAAGVPEPRQFEGALPQPEPR